jgi:hypothetical protein
MIPQIKKLEDNSRLKAVRNFKAQGGTVADCWKTMAKSIDDTARSGGWRASERAATIADAFADLEKVYGKKATKGLR